MSNKHTYRTSDLNELTKELQRRSAEGYSVVKGPEFAENEYFVELEREGAVEIAASAAVEEKPVEDVPAEVKPSHKHRGPKPKAKKESTEA